MNKFAYLVVASALAVSAFGQGQINLNNRGLALVNDASGKPLTGTTFVAQVWYGASDSTLTSSFAPSPFRASTTTYPGSWNPAATGGPGAIMHRETTAPIAADDFWFGVFEHVVALGEKDLTFATELADELGVDTPLARLALERLAPGLGMPHSALHASSKEHA